MSPNGRRRALQKLTDRYIAEIERITKVKEAELMEV